MEENSVTLDERRRTVVCVGACGGIGAATAQQLSAEGYRLVLIDARSDADLAPVRERCGEGSHVAFSCSIADAEQVEAVAAEIGRAIGVVDAVVNAAGVFHFGNVGETTPEVWSRVIDVNLSGLFFLIRALLPQMRRAPYARVVNILSIAALQGFANQTAYCASKWGGLGLSLALAEELRPERIYVTTISPGAVDTALWTGTPAFDRSKMLRAADVANAVSYVLRQPEHVAVEDLVIKPSAGVL